MANDKDTESREVLEDVNKTYGSYVIITSDALFGYGSENHDHTSSLAVKREEESNNRLTNKTGHEVKKEHRNEVKHKRGNYLKYSQNDKIAIGKLAAESGNTVAQRQFQTVYPMLAESTVRSFKVLYLKELIKKKSRPCSAKKKRGKYQIYSEVERAVIGKLACEMGNAHALRHFKDEFPKLSESTIRGFKNAYLKELERFEGESQFTETCCASGIIPLDNASCDSIEKADISILPRGKRGRPGKIPSDMERTILSYLQAIAAKEDIVLTYKTAIAIAKGVVMTENRFMLSEFGGELNIDKGWARSFFRRHHMHCSCDSVNEHPPLEQQQPFASIINYDSITSTNNLTHNIPEQTDVSEDNNEDNSCLHLVQSMVILEHDNEGSQAEMLALGPTLGNLSQIANMTKEMDDSAGTINLKIEHGHQSFIKQCEDPV